MSSRDLKELVFEQTTEMVNRPSTSESVDETGIVSTNDGEETVEVEKTVKGYCIGSEYVMK